MMIVLPDQVLHHIHHENPARKQQMVKVSNATKQMLVQITGKSIHHHFKKVLKQENTVWKVLQANSHATGAKQSAITSQKY